MKKWGHRALDISPGEIEEIAKNRMGNLYIFPKNVSWLFTINEFDGILLAGKNNFIDAFLEYYPEFSTLKFGDYCKNCQ